MAKIRTWYVRVTVILDRWIPTPCGQGTTKGREVAAFRLHDAVGLHNAVKCGDERGLVIRRGNSQFEFRDAPDHLCTYEREFYLAPYQDTKGGVRESWVVVKEGGRFTALSDVSALDLLLEREILKDSPDYVSLTTNERGRAQ